MSQSKSTTTALACTMTAGCTDIRESDDLELANIAPWHIVPKSSPRQLIVAFQKYCLATSRDGAECALRKNDYVAARVGPAMTSYLVDTSEPMVMITTNDQNFDCAVAAKARTGQANRIADYVADNFATAVAIDPKTIGPKARQAWAVSSPFDGILFTIRTGELPTPPQIIFGIHRNN